MRKLIVLFLIILPLASLSQYTYEITISEFEDQVVFDGIEDELGNLILVGRIGSNITHDYDPYFIKIDPIGDTLTKRIVSIDTNEFADKIILVENNTYLLIGRSGQPNSLIYNKMWFALMNSNLEITKQRYYCIPYSFYNSIALRHAVNIGNGNIVIAGTTQSSLYSDLCMIKINTNLDTLMTRFHHYEYDQYVDELTQIPYTAEFLMLGGKIGFYGTTVQSIIFDSIFNIQSIKNFPLYLSPEVSIGTWITDTVYLYSGTLRDTTNSGTDDDFSIALQLVDTATNVLKSKYYGKPDTTDYAAWNTSSSYQNDSTIYIGGFTHLMGVFWSPVATYFELYMIDANLNLLGYNQFGGDANYNLWGMVTSSDGGCVMYGTRHGEENGNYERDIYIVKVLRDDMNIITSLNETIGLEATPLAYPNPVVDILHILINRLDCSDYLRLKIADNVGRTIFNNKIIGKGNRIEVNLKSLNSGLYFYSVYMCDKLVNSGKFIKR